ncbi:ADK-domain-containing protein [Mycena polygramma]|nr:ADK-domain-containing protein [Mycena polygramma]
MYALRRPPATLSTSPRRCIGHTPASRRALPFFLNTFRAAPDERLDQGKILRLVIFGKPGAGKGTLTARLVKRHDKILSISSGDLLRQHIVERTDVGRQAEEIVAQGKLLPDDVMLKIVTGKLDHLRNKHWILDGFPRTVGQAQMLDAHLKKQGTPLSLVVNLDVPDEVILSRISDRWVHLSSGRVYNISYNPPKVDGLDDETGEPLTKRPDDNPEIFARRLTQFYASTSPLLAYYSAAAQKPTRLPRPPGAHPHQLAFPPAHTLLLKTLSGSTSDEIWPQLDALVRGAFPALKETVAPLETRRSHSLSDAIVAAGLDAVPRSDS